jgi:hypothetical protein
MSDVFLLYPRDEGAMDELTREARRETREGGATPEIWRWFLETGRRMVGEKDVGNG